MRLALITYDLRNVMLGDNTRVKQALESFDNVKVRFKTRNIHSNAPEWFMANLPNTTLLVDVNDPSVTTQDIIDDVISTINSVNATPGNIFVALLSEWRLWNP